MQNDKKKKRRETETLDNNDCKKLHRKKIDEACERGEKKKNQTKENRSKQLDQEEKQE